MKRGLVTLDPAEIPSDEWRTRVDAVRQELRAAEIDVALIYGDVFRSDDIGYLTNLCIYWNEGILAVPADGDPVFLTKLSPRVHTWMRRISTLTNLRSGPKFGTLVETFLADSPDAVIGLVDADLWPTALQDEIIEAAAPRQVRLLGDVVRRLRLIPSDAELALLREGAAVVGGSVDQAVAEGLDVYRATSHLESAIRGAGFTDLFVTSAVTPGGTTFVEVTGEYRHGWPHAARVLSSGTDDLAYLDKAFAAVIAAARGGVGQHDLANAARPLLADLPDRATWDVRCVNQADMSTAGEILVTGATIAHPTGAVVVIALEVLYEGGGRAVLAETVLLGDTSAEVLTLSMSDKQQSGTV